MLQIRVHTEATVFYKRLASLGTRNEMGSTLLLNPVLATLPPKFLSTKISNPVHSWGPLKRWSRHRPLWTWLCQNSNSTELISAHIEFIFPIIIPIIFPFNFVLLCIPPSNLSMEYYYKKKVHTGQSPWNMTPVLRT